MLERNCQSMLPLHKKALEFDFNFNILVSYWYWFDISELKDLIVSFNY